MKIFAFAGSNSSVSINKKLVSYVLKSFEKEAVSLVDLNDYEMPIFSSDREKEGIPDAAHRFAAHIDDADLIICSLAEHNGAYSAAFKNIMDWVSRIPGRKLWNGKPMLVMATSTGARGGSSVLEMATARIPFNGGVVMNKFSLPSFNANFTEEDGITNAEYKLQLEEIINEVKDQVTAPH